MGSPGLLGPCTYPPAASGAAHGRSLPSHPRLTPGCCGAATHLPSQRWGAQRDGGGMLAVSGGSAAPRGGEGEAPQFPCRAEAAFALPGGSLGSAGRGRSGGAVRGRAMPLPSYGFGHRGASRPPRSVPPGAVPTDRPWKGWECWWAASWAGASRVPRPHRTPAASLGCTNAITAQETEGRDCSPHSAFVRQCLSAAAGLGTAGIGNRPMRDEGPTGWWALEQLRGAERLREWGWLSRGQRRCGGQPAAPCQSLRGWASAGSYGGAWCEVEGQRA